MKYVIYLTESPVESAAFVHHCAADYLTSVGRTVPGEMEIRREPMGKPFFADPSLPHFSLSHSGWITVCAVGDGPCGIDVQRHDLRGGRDDGHFLKLANRFFHPEEAAFLREAEDIARCFFDLWAAKESYVKLTGEGIPAFRGFSTLDPPAVLGKIDLLPGFSLYLAAADLFEYITKRI